MFSLGREFMSELLGAPRGPQISTTENDPATIRGTGDTKNCGISINFKRGTYYGGFKFLKNGVSTVQRDARLEFGLGFTVNGWVKSGGIGTIGTDPNFQNSKGVWIINQETEAYIVQNGKITWDDKALRPDLNSQSPFSARGNTFSWYDHPGNAGNDLDLRRENFVVSVSNGDMRCEARFHLIQVRSGSGYSLHWGRGFLPSLRP
jgi:hypothetical protein